MANLLSAAATRLTAALGELKERVREAIAGETGKAVGEAVRLAVESALAGPDTPARTRPAPDPWDDPAADRWADPGGWADADDLPPPPVPDPPADTADRMRLAVAAGLAAGRWVLARGPLAAAVAVGGLVALAVLFGGPAAHAAARALTAAADLSAVSRALGPHRSEP